MRAYFDTDLPAPLSQGLFLSFVNTEKNKAGRSGRFASQTCLSCMKSIETVCQFLCWQKLNFCASPNPKVHPFQLFVWFVYLFDALAMELSHSSVRPLQQQYQSLIFGVNMEINLFCSICLHLNWWTLALLVYSRNCSLPALRLSGSQKYNICMSFLFPAQPP